MSKSQFSFKIHFISRNGRSENGWRWNQGLFAISWHWWILQEKGSCLEIIGGWSDWNSFLGFGGLWILHPAWKWNQYSRCCEVTICLHSLCSRNFQYVKLRLDFVEIWSFYCHSDFIWNQFMANSNGPKVSFLAISETLNF